MLTGIYRLQYSHWSQFVIPWSHFCIIAAFTQLSPSMPVHPGVWPKTHTRQSRSQWWCHIIKISSCQQIYRPLFYHCCPWEKCFLGHRGFFVAIQWVATGGIRSLAKPSGGTLSISHYTPMDVTKATYTNTSWEGHDKPQLICTWREAWNRGIMTYPYTWPK